MPPSHAAAFTMEMTGKREDPTGTDAGNRQSIIDDPFRPAPALPFLSVYTTTWAIIT